VTTPYREPARVTPVGCPHVETCVTPPSRFLGWAVRRRFACTLAEHHDGAHALRVTKTVRLSDEEYANHRYEQRIAAINAEYARKKDEIEARCKLKMEALGLVGEFVQAVVDVLKDVT
jgi:hypothetical protein